MSEFFDRLGSHLFGSGIAILMLCGSAFDSESLEIASSDGTFVPMPEFSGRGFSGFLGRQEPGARPDADSEFSASTLTPEERAELRKLRAPVPYYLRNAETGAVAESVIGSDARQRFYPVDSGYPERAIGQITFSLD